MDLTVSLPALLLVSSPAEALIAIRGEIEDVLSGKVEAKDSPLKHAPHTAAVM